MLICAAANAALRAIARRTRCRRTSARLSPRRASPLARLLARLPQLCSGARSPSPACRAAGGTGVAGDSEISVTSIGASKRHGRGRYQVAIVKAMT